MSLIAQPDLSSGAALQELTVLHRHLAALARADVEEEIYQAILNALIATTAADSAAVLTFAEDGTTCFNAGRDLSPQYREAITDILSAHGTRNLEPIVADVLIDETLRAYQDIFAREHIRGLALIPVVVGERATANLMLCYADPHESADDELASAQIIASQVALILERKRAESALAQSERRLSAILDNSDAVIFLKDIEGRYVLVNRRFEDRFHISKAEVVGRTDLDIFPAEIAERLRENDRKVLETKEPLTIEEEAPQNDGIHTYLSIKFPVEDAEGATSGLGGIATDITVQKQLETASLHLAAIVENSDDAIVSKDLNGIVTSWNRGAERIFGYTAAEMIGKPIATLAPPDRINEMPEILNKIRRGERVDHYEARRRRKNGEIIHVSLTVSPVRNAAGRIIGASKIARNISERKRIESERAVLLEREQAARKTAELLNRVGPMLVAELDLEKLVQSITDLATELVGAEFGSFFQNGANEQGESYVAYGLSDAPRQAFAGFPIPRNPEILGPALRGEGVVRCDDVTRDPRYGKNAPYYGMPSGHLPIRSYLAAPVVSRSGEVLGGLFLGHSAPGKFTEQHEAILTGIAAQAAIAMDNARLFERKQWVEDELKRSNEELRRANRDLETFAYSASHDLQEPLRTMALSAQLLERRYKEQLQGNAREFLCSIVEGARRMEDLIRDVLAYATASKQAEGVPPKVNSEKVLASVLEDLKVQIEQSGAIVSSERLPAVAVHENRLAQLFQNLISNSLKYRGNEAPRIHISATEQDAWSIFCIVDNGIGIDPKFANQVFALFKRLHSRDEYPGSGIGLAICQRIVEQYGGRIWLEKSGPGEGSTFCFALPTQY